MLITERAHARRAQQEILASGIARSQREPTGVQHSNEVSAGKEQYVGRKFLLFPAIEGLLPNPRLAIKSATESPASACFGMATIWLHQR
jgi:hypothetical protein